MFLKDQNGDRIVLHISTPGRNGNEMPSLSYHIIDLSFHIGTVAGTGDGRVFVG